jgi:diguanylate cyclase (GGDEF)-like protein
MTAAGMPGREARARRKSLHAQAVWQLATAIVVAMLVILAAGMASIHLFQERELAQRQEQLREHYHALIQRLEKGWHTAAVGMRSRLEFSRIPEEADPVRWPKLTAYLNTQWASNEFSNLLVLDGHGRVLFRYGSEAAALQEEGGGQEAGWLYLRQYGQLYRVYRVPLWLGMQGEGQLVLFKPLSNALLREMTMPRTELVLDYQGQTVAESREGSGKDLAGSAEHIHADMDWKPLSTAGPAPVLNAYRQEVDIHPYSEYILRPLATALVLAILLWLGLGRWMNRVTRRIETLGKGASRYTAGAPREALLADIAPAVALDDEIGQTARAFRQMIEAIESRDREQRGYLETLALLEEAVIELDEQRHIVRASPGWQRLSHAEDSLGARLDEFIHAEDVALLEAQSRALLAGEKGNVTLRLRLRGRDGGEVESWIECRLLPALDGEARVTGIRGVLRDITQTYLHEKQITHMALHDALTGLPNRVLLEDRVKVALRLAARTQHTVGICFIDLDNFKLINDSLGHKAGDRLLTLFARRLQEHLRQGDTLARWGGDEFVLLLPDLPDEASARDVAEKIGRAMQQPLDLDGTEVRATFSMGVALYPHDQEDMETLFSNADRAMFYAKAQGRNQSVFFRDMSSKGLGRKELYIQNRLAGAIDAGQIQAWCQPIVDAKSGRCTAVEVLARWHDKEHGWISPATFIPMAENLGLIRELGQQILVASLDAARRWREQGRSVYLAVNVSKRQLFTRSFAEQLLREVRERGLSPASVVLEVTESVALADVEHGPERVQELKQAGFAIAIDDFGTGYSSLSQLHEIRADELKIDISFVRRIHRPGGQSLVQAIISLARSFGLKTVAEGVEDEATAERLRAMGVDCLQGYHFGKPMPIAEFEGWLAGQAGGDTPGATPCG